MASIHKKKLGSGKVVFELSHGDGKERIRFIAGQTKEEAEATLSRFKRQLSLHGKAPEGQTVEAAVAEYGKYLAVNRSPATLRRYLRVLSTFAECFLPEFHPEVVLLRDVKPHHIESYKVRRLAGEITEAERRLERDREAEVALRQELAENPDAPERKGNAKYGWLGRKRLSPSVTKKTVNYELETLRTFFLWSVKRNYLFTAPTENVERFRLPKRSLPKFMTSDELSRFFAACSPWERRIFSILLLSGMRRGEMENLEWDDVRFDLGVILIREKEFWKPKTDERVIPLSEGLRAVLLEEYRERRSERWVAANREGGQEFHLLPKLKKICRKAGIAPAAATVHALRHSFGAHLRMAGVPLANIADLMGHRDLATTQIYAKVQIDHLREAVSRLSPLVSETPSPEPVTRAVSGAHNRPKLLKASELEAGEGIWLGGRDSNPDSAGQSRMSYR
jgi:integrase/recombinase XerD